MAYYKTCFGRISSLVRLNLEQADRTPQRRCEKGQAKGCPIILLRNLPRTTRRRLKGSQECWGKRAVTSPQKTRCRESARYRQARAVERGKQKAEKHGRFLFGSCCAQRQQYYLRRGKNANGEMVADSIADIDRRSRARLCPCRAKALPVAADQRHCWAK